MRTDQRTGRFLGLNKSGHADTIFFNNLGIHSYGYFDRKVLEYFITYPAKERI